MLANGFNTRQTDIRPANSINTAFQLLAVIFQLQSLQQFGGCSASHIDHTMVPYVRKSFNKHYINGIQYILGYTGEGWENHRNDSINSQNYIQYSSKVYRYAMDMTLKETQQAVEGMFHNLNTLQSRSGCQLPFTSINFGTCTLPEGRMITKAILEGSLKGVGKLGRTAIFPCTIFQYDKEINGLPGTPNYDLFQLALKSTSKRLYPNYVNCGWSNNTGVEPGNPLTYASTMGCRTWNSEDANGLGAIKDGRGNIAPVTIILPTLAMEAKEEALERFDNCLEDNIIECFMLLLDKKIHEAKEQLIERFTYICSHSADAAKFMYENNVMYGYVPEEGIISALKHGTLAIGQIALAETLQILLGCNHTNPEGLEVAKMIEQLFKDRCAEFKKEWYTFEFEGFPPTTCHLNFGVYYTPAESLCYTAMTKFKKKYGIIPNVSDKSFFTNSIHVPVWEHLNPLDKIKIESQLTGYSSAGCITYVELDSNCEDNLKALESLVSGAMEYDIPYFAINVPSDTCLNCGYTDEFDDKCPICGSTNLQHLRRVTGYLTGNYTTAFNLGKQEEVKLRYRHSKDWSEWKQQ